MHIESPHTGWSKSPQSQATSNSTEVTVTVLVSTYSYTIVRPKVSWVGLICRTHQYAFINTAASDCQASKEHAILHREIHSISVP